MERALAQRLTAVRLIEAYGRLLTPRQGRLLHLYYLDDFSLGEIAQRLRISRQAVYDSLKRSLDELQRLERSLHLVESADQQTRWRRQIAARLQAVEQAVGRLRGRVDARRFAALTGRVAALRRVCR